jgi:CBS domain containing-hemolysin-like protein
MRQHGSHVAKSVDESGTTRGLLFLEDAVEVLVGEIHDTTVE